MSSKQFHQYFSNRMRLTIVTPRGKQLYFNGFTYVTDKADEIEFLDGEIAAGNKMLYVKEEQKVVTAEQLDPVAAIKKKAVEEYLAAQQSQQDPERDVGKSVKGAEKLVTSKTIANMMAGSNAGAATPAAPATK